MDVEIEAELCELEGKNNVLREKYKKRELECQKWRERCVGLEATNKGLCDQKEELIKRCQDLNINLSAHVMDKEEYLNLVKENERLNVLTGSFFNVFIEIYRRVQPYTKGGQNNE